ncbi:unnamed protein product [Schistocephalus solidus]|uniref:Anaphase-promoting complex subunit 1 n=1 Tax=Schistocephalus solidus TaxID=70667 RepID=A0A183ST72_SCHSO|nr:unnamed protein product [Schistocephalus solidus]
MLSQSRPRTSLRTAAHGSDGLKVGESAEVSGCGDTAAAAAMPEDCDGPLRKAAFLALDMVDNQWVCFLTTRRRSDLSTRLVCLQAWPGASASSIRLADPVFLKAIDAVYVPDSRITVCLEASRSIVLYTGVVKVGFLGVVPSPSASLQTSPDKQSGPSTSPSFLLPLVVRPSPSDVAASSARGQISQLMSMFSPDASVPSTSALSSSGHNLYVYSDNALQKNLEIVSSSPASSSLSPQLGSDAATVAGCSPPSAFSSSSATPSHSGDAEGGTLVWRLCLPANNQFTLALMAFNHNPSDYYSFRSTESLGRSVCRRQLHIQLPPMSSDSLCERCLNGLRRGLPPQVGLDLLVRWFNHRNPPGGYQQLLHPTAFATEVTTAFGSSELITFSRFLLLTLGLLTEAEETEGDRQSAYALHTPNRLLMKRHRQWSGPGGPGGEERCGMQAAEEEEEGQRALLCDLVSTSEAAATAIGLQSRDPARWRLMKHLPAILLSLHLVYENEKLDVLSRPQLKPLAAVNHILANLCIGAHLLPLPEKCGKSVAESRSRRDTSTVVAVNVHVVAHAMTGTETMN